MTPVFISYSSNDGEKASRLAQQLKKESISVWIDTDSILPGHDLLEEMKDGIYKAQHVLVCLSPSFTKKPPTSWVKHELRMAMLRENESSKRIIIPVRLKKGGDIPTELGTRAYADLSSSKKWEKNFPRLLQAIRGEC